MQAADFSILKALKTRSAWLFMSIWLLFSSNLLLVSIHLVPHAMDIGFSAEEAAIALSLLGIMSIIGRVLMGKVSDTISRKTTAIICSLAQVGAMAWLIWAHDLWSLYLATSIYGFAYSGFIPPVYALIGDTFGLRNIGVIMGVLDIGWAAGGAIGPAIGGLIFDVNNTYSIAFLMGSIALLVATVLTALIRRETTVDEHISRLGPF
jgi:MFS family permease